MPKLTISRGISGSGKSTWARSQNAVVISRDAIRHGLLEISPAEWYALPNRNEMEDLVTQLEHAAIGAALKMGKDVISDNTNINWKSVKALAKIGYRYGAAVETKTFDVPVNVAIERDAIRLALGQRGVGAGVIRKQAEQFKHTRGKALDPVQEVRPYNGTPGKPKAFLVDIDGTLAHMRDYRGPFDWGKVGLDDVDEKVRDIVYTLADEYTVVVMSGRDESCREATVKWLKDNIVPFYPHNLFMRPRGDMRPDNIIKAELFDTHVRDNFDVQFVLDDRDQVVDMWRRMGITCLQVAPGDF